MSDKVEVAIAAPTLSPSFLNAADALLLCMAGFNPSPSSRSIRNLRLFALLAWSAGLAGLSLAPDVQAPAGLQLWDKLNHFFAYAVLALLLLRLLLLGYEFPARLEFFAWLACFAYGLLLETLQGLMRVGRVWELGDLLANGCGALVACVLFRHVRMRPSNHGQ